jgi:hypothetical protein
MMPLGSAGIENAERLRHEHTSADAEDFIAQAFFATRESEVPVVVILLRRVIDVIGRDLVHHVRRARDPCCDFSPARRRPRHPAAAKYPAAHLRSGPA